MSGNKCLYRNDAEIVSYLIGSVCAEIAGDCGTAKKWRELAEKGLSDQGGRRETTDGFTQHPLAYPASAALYAGNSAAAWRIAEVTERITTQDGVSMHYNQALTY